MKRDLLSDLLHVRLLVGYLGEADQYGWWKTNFYQAASQHFLEPIFPRTSHLARYHGVVEAARRVHDESLSVGSYHLFRLPEELEHDLYALMTSDAHKGPLGTISQGKDSALSALRSHASDTATSGEGPVSIGNVDLARTAGISGQVAGIYAAAYTHGTKAFPYMVRQ
ncbi:hypothetical protein EV130_110153 [Rhizobium azibense]|uniref:BrxE family protein n=1 Tax=Rhizobium azibense TaxID=1136135 RepID=A0A4R3QL65_9HYPH|nr:BrxE family protein [Rhizobium azibense]TCU21809.1 hypothetical protein EV130_110153 [Rhizobium azibense]